MAEYLIQEETLIAIGDETRELAGITDSLSPSAIITNLGNANDTVDNLGSLVTQIIDALEGKAAGNGSGGVELPELTNEGTSADLLSGKQLISSEGTIVTGTIPTKTSSDLTASGATVTVPSGYYNSQVTKSVDTANQATPSVSIDANGKITASVTQTAGYVSAGTKSGTKQLITQASKTITPSTSSQTAVASGVYTTGTVTVAAIPSTYVQPSGTKTITTNGTHDVKSYACVSVNVASTGEDVTAETNAYTEKITQLTSAVTALENELAGKASGGGASSTEKLVGVINYNTTYDTIIHYTAPDGDYKTKSIIYQEASIEAEPIEILKNTLMTFSNTGGSFLGGPELHDVVGVEIIIDQYGDLYKTVLLPVENNFVINIK